MWAWLIPGCGHLYQGRYAKGVLFLVCIMGTYLAGFAIGGPNVVYASWTKTDRRLQYVCQAGVGLAALPAIVQSYRVIARGGEPIRMFGVAPLAPPRQPVLPNNKDELAEWHAKYGFRYEMGTLYTMIAGLLNVLAIYDACCGPVLPTEKDRQREKEKREKAAKAKDDSSGDAD